MSEPNKRPHSPSQNDTTDNGLKVQKMESGDQNDTPHAPPENNMFTDFVVDKILGENSQNKIAFIQGHYKDHDEPAVIVLEKTPFNESAIHGMLQKDSETTCFLHNDIYRTLELVPTKDFAGVKTTMIYPATRKHIAKYQTQEVFLLEETGEDYKNITLPYLNQEQFSNQWVYNILEKKKESERIVFEDADPETGFILLPDMKWDCKQTEDLYLVAIAHKHGIKSLRDLNKQHLPLLRNILHQGTAAINEKYKVPGCKLRIYLHYQPSYYHLHVHFTHLRYQAPGSGVERAHLLSDVIDNLELDGEYYKKKTLSFTSREGDKLYQLFKEKGCVV